jgi:hypothetical protein
MSLGEEQAIRVVVAYIMTFENPTP